MGNKEEDPINSGVLITSNILKAIMASAVEAECRGLYENAKEVVPMRVSLEEICHPNFPHHWSPTIAWQIG
eukprot:15350146-Ditylum_brightwellii.AAC.1